MRNKPANRISRIFDHVLTIGAILSGVLLVFVMLSIAIDVALRYSLNQSLEWAVEISEYTLVAITFFAAAWVLKRNKHVNMDQLFNTLGTRTQNVLNAITSILSAIACLILVWYGIRVTLDQIQTGDRYYTTLEAPKWPVSAIIVVGFLLLLFQFLRRIRRYFAEWKASSNR